MVEKPLVVEENRPAYEAAKPEPPAKKSTNTKLASLAALRQKIAIENGQPLAADKPLVETELTAAWTAFIEKLKADNQSCRQGYEAAKLVIKDENSFEAIVTHKLDVQFIEKERKEAGEFLKKQLGNRLLQFTITLIEDPKVNTPSTGPLSLKDQYLKLVEEYPMVKELKDRLKLELDY